MADTQLANIGKYHIIELLGEGAMGVVYKARDSVLDRTVAIKVMNESIARQDDLRKRFLREAQAAASLQHPNVVCVYDLGDSDGHLFIAMEFIEGVDLEKLMELKDPLSLQAKLDIVIDVLTGLTFAHKRGIIHRDIKPANIRVTEEGRAKIMDFGVAHLMSSSMTTTGAILGTPSYMAPEQVTEGKTTPGTDIFAVGGVLFQLLTQMKPFEGPTLQNLFFKIMTENPKPVTELVPGLPPALDRIVAKAMAKEPDERYTSALEMANDLTNVRSKLSGASYPATVSLTASVSSAIEQARRKRETRSRGFAFAGVGAVAAVVLLIGWSMLLKSRASVAETTASQVAATTGAITPTPAGATDISAQLPVVPPAQTMAQKSVAAPLRSAPQKVATKPPQPPKVSAPVPKLTQETVQSSATQSAATVEPQTAAVSRPVQPPPQDPVVVAPAPATTSDIAPIVEAYARAIESKDVGAIRRVYPGLTADQQRGFEQFFQSARDINVTFRVAKVDGTASSADARLVGTYQYVNSDGRAQSQPVSFAATLRREGAAWRFVAVR
ncbi:MAG: protein kinase domain-containing protein [Gemmatimonadaceae bacterium]